MLLSAISERLDLRLELELIWAVPSGATFSDIETGCVRTDRSEPLFYATKFEVHNYGLITQLLPWPFSQSNATHRRAPLFSPGALMVPF